VKLVLAKVISGGQSGVDVAALRAAKRAGLQTGGWMPSGFRTLDGDRPEYAAEYGMVEHESRLYPPRTGRNVAKSDATLRLAVDFESAGERCTLAAIRRHRRPHLDVPFHRRGSIWTTDVTPSAVAAWIVATRVLVLNVAGNSEQTAPGIGLVVEKFLLRVFEVGA
jgi:putative molybdenum carrier protein